MVMSPAIRPNSSTTSAIWLRVFRKSRNKSFRPLLSGINTGGRNKVRILRAGARCSLSRSLANKIPMMLSRSPSYTGKRECAVSMTWCMVSSSEASIWIKSIRAAATMTLPAVNSAMRKTPSSMMRLSAPMTWLSSASAKTWCSASLLSGFGRMRCMNRCQRLLPVS